MNRFDGRNVPDHWTRQCWLRLTASIFSLAGIIAFAVAISNSPSTPSLEYVFPILGMIISICWSTFNVFFLVRTEIPVRPAVNVSMDLIILILLVGLGAYALICTRSVDQRAVSDSHIYGGAVGSAFAWLAAIFHLMMFIHACLETHRLRKSTVTTIPDMTDLERAAIKERRTSRAKLCLRALSVLLSLSGFICFVAAIALNNDWYSVALNIEYYTGAPTYHLTQALAADYFPLAPFCLSLLIPPLQFLFHTRHARSPRTTRPLHPIYPLLADLTATLIFISSILLAAATHTYLSSNYSLQLCQEDHCVLPSASANSLKISGISLAIVVSLIHLTLTILYGLQVNTSIQNWRAQRKQQRLHLQNTASQSPFGGDGDTGEMTTTARDLFPTTNVFLSSTNNNNNGRRPSAISESMKFQREALAEYNPSPTTHLPGDGPRLGSFSGTFAAAVRKASLGGAGSGGAGRRKSSSCAAAANDDDKQRKGSLRWSGGSKSRLVVVSEQQRARGGSLSEEGGEGGEGGEGDGVGGDGERRPGYEREESAVRSFRARVEGWKEDGWM